VLTVWVNTPARSKLARAREFFGFLNLICEIDCKIRVKPINMNKTLLLVACSLFLSNLIQAQWYRDYSLCYNPEGILYDSAEYYYTGEVLDSIVHFQLDKSAQFYDATRFEYTYDENGNVLTKTTYTLSVGGTENVTRETCTYSNGFQTELISQFLVDGNWVNYYRILTSYDANQIVEQESAENWVNDNWEPAYQIIYTNDANGHVSSVQSYYYMEIWYEEFSSTYSYLDGNLILIESIDYEDNPIYMAEYTFDTDNNVVYQKFSTWASSYNTWLYNDDSFEYDSNGNLIHEESGYLTYTGGGTTYYNTGTCDHFYFQISNIQNTNENAGILIYPNPSHNLLSVGLTDDYFKIEISDAQGKIIRQELLRNGVNHFSIENLDAGIYFLRFTSDTKTTTVRWVKN
jgi:hypothetical protein